MNNKCFLLVVVGLVLVIQGGVEAATPSGTTTVAQCKASQNDLFVNPLIASKQTNYHNLVLSKCIAKALASDHNIDCDFSEESDVERALAEYLSSCSSAKGQSNIIVTSTVNFHHKNKNVQATISWFQCISSSCSIETHLPYIVASRVREVSFGASEVNAPEGYTVDYIGGLKFKISSNEPVVYPPYGYSSSSSYSYYGSSSSSYPYGYSSSSSYPYGYSSSSSYYGYSYSSSYPYGYSSSSSNPYGYSSSSSYPYGYSSSSSYPYGYSSSSSYPYGYSSSSSYYGYSYSSSYPYGYSSSSSYPYGYSSSSSDPYGYSSSSSDPYGYSSSSYYPYEYSSYYGDNENEGHEKHHNKHNKEHHKDKDHKSHKSSLSSPDYFEYARRFIPIVFVSMFLVVLLWAIIRRRQANRQYQFLEPSVCHKV